MLMSLAKMDVKDADVILKEIINAQRTGILTGPSNETAPVRDMYGVLADQQNVGLSSAEAYIRHSEDTYLHTP